MDYLLTRLAAKEWNANLTLQLDAIDPDKDEQIHDPNATLAVQLFPCQNIF